MSFNPYDHQRYDKALGSGRSRQRLLTSRAGMSSAERRRQRYWKDRAEEARRRQMEWEKSKDLRMLRDGQQALRASRESERIAGIKDCR